MSLSGTMFLIFVTIKLLGRTDYSWWWAVGLLGLNALFNWARERAEKEKIIQVRLLKSNVDT